MDEFLVISAIGGSPINGKTKWITRGVGRTLQGSDEVGSSVGGQSR